MNTEISATSEHPFNPRISHNSITTNRRKNEKKEKERKRNRRINQKQFSHTDLENVPLSNRRPFFANHRRFAPLFGLFRKESRQTSFRAKRRREREKGGEFHEPLGEDNLTIRAKGRCCTRRCAIRFYCGNARLVSSAALSVEDFGPWCRVAAPYSTVCNARPLSKYRSQFSPAK